jgi:hypothetical protein
VRGWIATHADKIDEIDPVTAGICPEAAVAVVHRGGHINLAGHNGSDWRLQARALWRVGTLERDLAVAVLQADKARIADSLSKLGVMDCEELPAFLGFLEQFVPNPTFALR